MVLKRGSEGCHCVYPIKIDLLLLNVSQNPNWRLFLEELASELGLRVSQIELINFYVLSLSRLNISMDITPHAGISFSAVDASAINSSLTMHKIRLDPTLVGDYSLLNITWFKPPPRSQGISNISNNNLRVHHLQNGIITVALGFIDPILSLVICNLYRVRFAVNYVIDGALVL